MREKRKACLFYEIGTGKTFTALDALSKLPRGKVLIAAPKLPLLMVWLVEKRIDVSFHDIDYVNYEKIARDKDFGKKKYDYVILDEVHKLKGKSTNTSKRLRNICRSAKYVFGLTGTPIANSYLDVFHIFKNMDIPVFSNYSEMEFLINFFYTYKIRTAYGSLLLPSGVKASKERELCDMVAERAIVRKLVECVDMPEKTTDVIYIDGMVTDKYREIHEGLFITEHEQRALIPFVKVQKLHQAANGFVYDSFKNTIRFAENKKLAYLYDLLETKLEETEKVIVVYFYEEDLKQLMNMPYKYTLDKQTFMEDDSQVLLFQFKAGEGINLQDNCSQMIFYTYDYSHLSYAQTAGRIYRTGQTKPTNYTVLINRGTIEEKIWWAVEHKRSLDEFLKEALHHGQFESV